MAAARLAIHHHRADPGWRNAIQDEKVTGNAGDDSRFAAGEIQAGLGRNSLVCGKYIGPK